MECAHLRRPDGVVAELQEHVLEVQCGGLEGSGVQEAVELGRAEAGVAGGTQVGRDADDVVEAAEYRAGVGELPRGLLPLVLWQVLRLLLLRLLLWRQWLRAWPRR